MTVGHILVHRSTVPEFDFYEPFQEPDSFIDGMCFLKQLLETFSFLPDIPLSRIVINW